MDARPPRPRRGTEDVLYPLLPLKHKSTGNLAMAAANAAAASATAGFRGPAKRAAFGDVSNTSKTSSTSGHDGKLAKLQQTGSSIANSISMNKENVPFNPRTGRDLLPRQPLRLSAILNKSNAVVTAPAPEPRRKPVASHNHDANPAVLVALDNKTYPIGVARFRMADAADTRTVPSASVNSSNGPPLQPRHHKSQPQLKQQSQPSLRRTQSKQLERVEHVPNKAARVSIVARSDLIAGMPARIAEEQIYADPQGCVVELERLPRVNHAEHVELSSRHVRISDEAQQQPHPAFKDSHTQALSEGDEYWDEEEDEDYDEQDQAYTTTQSLRSQNFTTVGITTILAPRITTKTQRELEEAKLEVQQMRSLEDIEEEMFDVSMVAEYGEEIFEYLRELEINMQPNPHYMEMQTEIQWSMRSVLMDWLVQVHNRFSLLPETLFLTVNYIDRFLSCKIVSIGKLQLVGATAILVASKYEEINCPSLEEIVYMVDGGYTTEEILKAERFMLSMLSFELGWPGPMSFLRRVSKADDYDLDTRTLAKYFLELTIMDERFVASPPSFLAAGAHCLSRLILKKGDWTKAHVHYAGYTWVQLRPLITMMIECCDQPRLHHAAVFEKYQEKRFKEASTVVQHALDAGFTLPHQNVPIRPLRGMVGDLSDAPHYSNNLLVPIEG